MLLDQIRMEKALSILLLDGQIAAVAVQGASQRSKAALLQQQFTLLVFRSVFCLEVVERLEEPNVGGAFADAAATNGDRVDGAGHLAAIRTGHVVGHMNRTGTSADGVGHQYFEGVSRS